MYNQRRWSGVIRTLLALAAICGGQFIPVAAIVALAQTPVPDELPQTPLPDIGTLNVGYMPTLGYAPVFVAIEKGYFEEQGLDVETQSFRSGSYMIPFLSTGDLDVGAGESGTALFNAIAQGLDVNAVASLVSQPPGYGAVPLLVRTDLLGSGEVTGPADLEGRKVGINIGRGVVEYLLSEALAQAGLTVDDVELIALPFPDMPLALENKAVDAVILPQPLAGKAIESGAAVVLIPGDEIVDTPQVGVLYFGQRLLEPANREAAVRFLAAYLKGARDLQGEGVRSEENVAIISEFTGVPPEVVVKAVSHYFDPDGEIHQASTESIQDYLVSRGYTEFSEPLPLQRVITDTFLMEAVERLGRFEPVAPDSDGSQD